MSADYGVGRQRALLAAQGVGYEPTPHLDGDGKWHFIRQTLSLVLRRSGAVSEEFLDGARVGAIEAWERLMDKEIVQ